MGDREKRNKWKARKAASKKRLEDRRYPLVTVASEMQERQCGGCTACCEAIAVHEIDKPVWTRCQHQCESGCGVYEDRPEPCRVYQCLWRGGVLKGEENRPDKLGLILDLHAEGEFPVLSAWEMWEGAADLPRVTEILEELGKRMVIVVRRYRSKKRRIVGPVSYLKGMVITEYE
jgi:hypothetical protein